jgi:hypothetical protein
MRDIIEGMPSYSTHLAEENEHVGECLGCQLRVEGHGWGLGLLGVKEAILEGLLIGQSLDVIPGCVGSSPPLKVRHMFLAQKAKSLRPVTESLEICGPGTSPPGFLMARQISLMMSSVRLQSTYRVMIIWLL